MAESSKDFFEQEKATKSFEEIRDELVDLVAKRKKEPEVPVGGDAKKVEELSEELIKLAGSRLPANAEQFLRYFEGINRDYPGQHWQNGIEICRRWLAMQAQESITQAEIDEFIERWQAEPNPGTGWWDLGNHFEHWARSLGYRVVRKR